MRQLLLNCAFLVANASFSSLLQARKIIQDETRIMYTSCTISAVSDCYKFGIFLISFSFVIGHVLVDFKGYVQIY